MVIKESLGDKIFNAINTVILSIATLFVLYPLVFIVSASVSEPDLVNAGQVMLFPKGLNVEGYRELVKYAPLWIGYRNTIFYTLLGTGINLLLTLTCAYALSRKEYAGRNFVMRFITFTMFFNGGMIPFYIVVKTLGLRDTIWALVLPVAVNAYNLIVSKTYFQTTIPYELYESAKMDGCSDARMFVSIVLPLAPPIIAVMSLFYGVMHWNQFFNSLLFIDKRELVPLQLVLRDILLSAQSASNDTALEPAEIARQARLVEVLKYGIIIVSSLPVVMVYPFFQRYFIKGIMVGAIKG